MVLLESGGLRAETHPVVVNAITSEIWDENNSLTKLSDERLSP